MITKEGMGMPEPDYAEWFECAYTTYIPKMLKIAVRRLGDKELAQEVVHDTFVILWESRIRVKDHPNLEGFLMKTLGNEILHKLRYLNYRKETPLTTDFPVQDQYDFGVDDLFPNGLSESDRKLLVWHLIDEMPYAEIAVRLKVSEGVCRVRIYRAKQRYIKLQNGNML
ncbi:MAG: RNA polymerase sigma factor [Flavonifractor plautii]|jgi:RNA polymerase sigma-70 factor (ECF subfamily)|nr:sigma-70 family RNA polymerase sigma factor [Clostridiales bacterium]